MKWIRSICALLTIIFTTGLVAETASTIPVLDMNMFYHSSTRDMFVKELSNAFHEVGFVAIVNTGIDPKIIDHAYDTAQQFFALDLDQKMQDVNPDANGQRGYIVTEKAKGMKKFDHKEFYHMGRILNEEQQNRLHFYENIWPREVNFHSGIYPLYKELERYLIPLEQAIAQAIDISPNMLHDMTREGDCLLRIIHYPKMKNSADKDVLWAGEHTDIDLLTILPKATCDGLELMDAKGNWVRVKVPSDAFIVNAGDMLENLTNGYFRSARHRVRAVDGDTERYSMVLFIHPRNEDRLDPLPHCIERTGGVKKFADANRWELLMERLADLRLASPEMLQELSRTGLMERLIEVGRASPDAMRALKESGFASPAVLEALEHIEKPNSSL